MKTKRFVSVLMFFVLLLSLVACEKKNSPTPSATTDLTPTAKATETPVPSPSATPTAQVTPTEKPTLTPTAELTPTEEPVSGTPTPTEEPVSGTPTPTQKAGETTPTPTQKAGTTTPTPTQKATEKTPTPTVTSVPTNTPVPTTSVQPATGSLLVENADGKTASDLSDDWEIKKYDNNWVDTGASIGVDESYNAANGNCMVANCWNNTSVFRYSRSYKADKGYNTIEFDAKGDDTANLKIQLMNSTDGVYTTIDLGKASSKWCHYVISLDDPKWKVKYAGAELALSDALAYVGMSKSFELIAYCDLFNIILSGQTENGATTHIYFDNIKFTYSENSKTSVNDLNVPDKLVMNFDEVNGWGDTYTSSKWTRFKFVTDGDHPDGFWKPFDTGINDYNSSKVGSKLLGLTTGWKTNFMYRYIGNGNKLGSFDHFSVDLGTYNAKMPMKVKLACVTTSGDTIYLMGSADSMKELQPNPTMQTYTFDFGKRTEIKEFYFCVYSADDNGDHLFIDNIKLY